jgi:winged helix DNA-binding protein
MAKPRTAPAITAAQAAAFRLARHHLADRSADAVALHRGKAARLVDVVRDTGGIQAQVMSAAAMALWTRRRSTTREEIRAGLFDRRDIVKTSAMRLTLHLIPASDLATVIAALKPMSMASLQRWHARVGAKPDQVKALVDSVMEGLRDGPQTQQALIARARKRAGKAMRVWLDHSWGALRPAIVDGLIVYGPPRGPETTFVRVDQWLGAQPEIDVADARAELLRRFLSAFGPATAHDFAKWSGIKTSDARIVMDALGDEIVEVSVDGAAGWIRRADLGALGRGVLDGEALRLLGPFDSFLLAHATKEHLVEPKHYKRVYRPQGWISPVVLRGASIIGVWFPTTSGKTTTLRVELFGRMTPAIGEALVREAEAMGRFLGGRCAVRFGTV